MGGEDLFGMLDELGYQEQGGGMDDTFNDDYSMEAYQSTHHTRSHQNNRYTLQIGHSNPCG
jgi:hypothetical protein